MLERKIGKADPPAAARTMTAQIVHLKQLHAKRQQLLAVTEKWPMQVLEMDAPLSKLKPGLVDMKVSTWEVPAVDDMPSTDLAAIEQGVAPLESPAQDMLGHLVSEVPA